MENVAHSRNEKQGIFSRTLEVSPKKFPGVFTAGELVRMKFPDPPPATDRTISLIHEASQKLNQRISRYPNCSQCNKRVSVKSGFICVDWQSYRADNASWYYGHARCTPRSPYDFRLYDFKTLYDVVHWTAHLSEKCWFDGGSWLSIVNYVCPQFTKYVEDALDHPHYWREFIFRGKKPTQQENDNE